MNEIETSPEFDDNPEWTEADFARARPASEVHPPHVVAALIRGKGRPKGSNKESISLRVDRDVLERYRAAGPGWQSRMNDDLRKAIGL